MESLMGVIKRLNKNNQRTISFFKAFPQLFMMFNQQTKIPFLKISLLVFFGKFINMIVMFMPLKMLFVLSGSKNIAFLHTIEASLGREVYIGVMLALITIFYLLNIVLQLYKAKLILSQKALIEQKDYFFKGELKSHKIIEKTYLPFCQIMADALLVLVVLTLTLFINWQYGVFFLFIIFLLVAVVEQWAFPTHQTNLMKKLKIDSKQFINITGVLFYLVLFMGILALVLNTDIPLILALLTLILVRLGNNALKSFFSSQIKIRRFYF